MNLNNIYVSLRLRVQNAVFPQPCVGKFEISLVLLNFLHCNFRLWFETPYSFKSYPCHASEMIRNTLNHCLKFALHSIFCHICYGKISEKNVNTFIKVTHSNHYPLELSQFQNLCSPFSTCDLAPTTSTMPACEPLIQYSVGYTSHLEYFVH